MKYLVLSLLLWGFSVPATAKTLCYFLTDANGKTTSYKEPPWDVSYPPKPISRAERERRRQMGHLVVSYIDGPCFDSALETSDENEKEKESTPPPPEKTEIEVTETIEIESSEEPVVETVEEIPVEVESLPAAEGSGIAATTTEIVAEEMPATAPPKPLNPSATTVDCASKSSCGQMKNCAEARLFMKQCDLPWIDDDGNGVPCDLICALETDTVVAAKAEDAEKPGKKQEEQAAKPEVVTLEGHTANITAVGIYGGEVVSNARSNGEFKFWEIKSRRMLRNTSGLEEAYTLQVAEGTMIIGFESGADNLQLWDMKAGRRTRALHGHSDSIRDLALSGSQVLASTSLDDSVIVWNLDGGEQINILRKSSVEGTEFEVGETESGFSTVAVDKGLHLVAASSGNTVYVWDYSKVELLNVWIVDARITTMATAGGKLIIGTERQNGIIEIYDIRSGKLLSSLEGHLGTIHDLVTARNLLVSASQDGSIKIWDWKQSRLLQNIADAHNGIIFALAVDWPHIVSGSKDLKVKLWLNYLNQEFKPPEPAVKKEKKAVEANPKEDNPAEEKAGGEPKFDASSEKTLEESTQKVKAALSPKQREELEPKLVALYMAESSSNPDKPKEEIAASVATKLNGKTAAEVFAMSTGLTQ